jgi:adenylate cyclase
VDDLEVPATVEALLSARIDRLCERDKRLLQTAAVIGREVSELLLREVAELPETELHGSLEALKSGEFLFESALFPVVEYAFRHPLTQEVALRSQLQQRRAQTHAAVAGAIERAAGEKLDEQAALLAHHWEQAGEHLVAARWHRRAALWSGETRIEESFRHWQRVRVLLSADATEADAVALATEARLRLLNLFWQFGASTEEAEAVYQEGHALAETVGDRASLALMEGALAAILGVGGAADVEQLQKRLRDAVRLARESGDPEVEAVNRWRLGYALTLTGRLEESLANSEAILELAGGNWRLGYDVVGWSPAEMAHVYRRMVYTHMGRLDEALRAARSADEVGQARIRETGSPTGFGLVRSGQAYITEIDGAEGRGEVVEFARRGVEMAETYGAAFARVLSLSFLATSCLVDGLYGEALEAAEAANALSAERMTGVDQEAERLYTMAQARLGLGDLEGANSAAREGVELARRTGTPIAELRCRLALTRALLAAGDGDAAREQIDMANAAVDATGAEAYRPFLLIESAALARLRGDESVREQCLAEARERFAAMPAPVRVEQVEALLRDTGRDR